MSRRWSTRDLSRPFTALSVRHRGVVALVVMALLGSFVVSASSWAPPDLGVVPVAEAPDKASAMAAASKQGSRVEVSSLRTESASTFANPSGSWTLEQSVGPVRVRRGAGWVPVDTTLTRAEDGLLTARATTARVAFSPGGSVPLVRLSAGEQALTLSWPRPLPVPVVSGETATYSDVFPGVDLLMRATPFGFGHELVVKTREAAANPELRRIPFRMVVDGVRLVADPAGNLTATDDSGAVVFTAGAPLMWDSPAEGAARMERSVGVEVGADVVTLLPDLGMLADSAARLPIVIDPQYRYVTPNAGSSWTLIRRSHPGNSHWNLAPRDQDESVAGVARVGHAPDWPDAYLDRSLFQFDTTPVRGATIVKATFQIYQVWKYAHTCDPNAVDPMKLHLTSGINSGTTWDDPPVWHQELSEARSVPKIGKCDPDWVGMNAQGAVQQAASGNWSNVTLGLKANDEGPSGSGWKRFYVQQGVYPKLAIEYNTPPKAPANIGTEPNLVACRWCGGVPYVGPTTLNLKADVVDPDGGQVTAWWAIFNKPGGESRHQTATSGRFATPLDTRTVAHGTTVTWEMQASDGALNSPVVHGPKFVVDRAVPKRAPLVESTLYPEDNRWHGGVGVPGTFTFRPDLESGEANDIDHYLWGWQDPPSTKVDATGALGGPATVTVAPTGDGPRTLYVQSVDRAGNKSPTKAYRFYVRAGNGAVAQWSMEGNAQDTAFLGDRHGTVSGQVTFGPGAVGSAVQFDGSRGNDLTAPNTVSTRTSFTVMSWVRLTDRAYARTAVSQDGVNFPGFMLWYRPENGGRWGFGMANSDATYGGTDQVLSPGAAQSNWTHLAGVYDAASNKLLFYVDGKLVGTAPRTVASWDATGPVRMGQMKWDGSIGAPWAGAVDEVRVYDRVVDSAEISAAVSTSNVQVAHWKFDEAVETAGDPGTTARNSVDGGDMAVLTDGATFVRNDGEFEGAVRFDGDNDTVTTHQPTVRTDQSFSVAAWVRLDDVGNDSNESYAVLSQDGEHVSGFNLEYQATNERWAFVMPHTDEAQPAGYDTARSAVSEATDNPTHLVVSYDAAAKKIRLHVDGVLVAEGPRTQSWQAAGAFQVGRAKLGGTGIHFLKGVVDEVRVYSRAITTEEVQGILSQGDVTVGSWKLDGDPNDSSGNDHHGQLGGTVDWAAGQTSMPDPADLAARFNGQTSYISAPHAVDTDRGFSVSAWARVDQPGKQATVVSEDGTNVSGFMLRATAAGRWSFGMHRSDVTGGGDLDEVVGTAVQVGAWTHLAAVYYKGGARLELYVNGDLAGTAVRIGVGFNASRDLQIGRTKFNGQYFDYFTGAVDDVSVYSRPLFLDEIRTMAGRDLSLVHNWQLDEPSGTNAADSVGARSGVLTGDASFGEGRVGNGVLLDGVDGVVSTTGVDLRSDASFSVSAFVNMGQYDCQSDCRFTAVSMNGGSASKFRLGYHVDTTMDPRGYWTFEMPEADGTVTEAAVSVLPGELKTWVHLVGVYDAPTKKVWLYVDGNRIDDGTLITPWSSSGGLLLGRGTVAGAPADFWPGGVDEVRLYTGALDRQRVESLNRSFPAPAAPPALPTPDAGHWKFDDNTGTTVLDSSRGLAATTRGGAGWINGRSGSAGSFDGTTGYAETAAPALNTSRSFSVTAWAYLTNATIDRTIVGQDGGNDSVFQLQYDADSRKWAVVVPPTDQTSQTVVVLTSTESAGLSDWTHLAMTFDADAGQIRLYVNGLLSATQYGVSILSGEGAFTIGRGKWNGTNVGFFSRGIDDVRAFDDALSDGEVRRIHADTPTGEFGSWRFDDGTTRDYTTRANHATPVAGGTSFGPGISGSAVQFDGATGAATTSKVGVTMRDSFTIATWVKLNRNDRVATVVAQDGTRMSGFSLQYRPDINRWAFGARTADSDGAQLVYAQGQEPAMLNQWVHLVGVYDNAARQARLYVNGRLAGTKSLGALWLATGGLTIGRGKVNGQPAEYFTGAVDEVRVDQGAASDTEIARQAGWPTPPTGVLGSFINATGDHYTSSTSDPVRPGYHYETSLGMVPANALEGTRPLFGCVTGADAYTSTDSGCEGGTLVSETGRVYAAVPEGVPTVAVHRCIRGGDRYDAVSCGDDTTDVLLGYSVGYSPLARYVSRIGRDHWATVDGTTPSYVYEGVLGWVPLVAQPGTQPLMSCRDGVDEFTSVDPACEGKQILDAMGHIWAAEPSGYDVVPLYRCVINNQRFVVSHDATCDGYTFDRQLGYVLAESPVPEPAAEVPALPAAIQQF